MMMSMIRGRVGGRGLVALAVGTLMVGTSVAGGQAREIAPERLTFEHDGERVELPYSSTHALSEDAEGAEEVRRVVVILHGTNRNAVPYHRWGIEAMMIAGNAMEHTAIVSPQFLMEVDIDEHEPGDRVLFWTNPGWKEGDLSLSTDENPRGTEVSSYAAMDALLEAVDSSFPSLEKIVLAGHSAGGQFVNRYAASTRIDDAVEVSIRFVVSNPSSYVYFTPERPDGEGGFGVPENGDCDSYDLYKYGLRDANEYFERAGLDDIAERYASREVVYLKGGNDNDPEARYLDTRCPAMAQGAHRLERGENYFAYIVHLFGNDVKERHSIRVSPGIGHNARQMFSSPKGLLTLFDFGEEEAVEDAVPVGM